ncbi:transcriptional regulator TetR family [Vibrio astriarenae]|nr:transcriptional regulator TetR family [Vibrio sp. C7]
MSRITKLQKEQNYAIINAMVLDLFLKEGWTKVTYDRVSKITGLRKSTLQGYYPTSNDFLIALKSELKGLFLSRLDFSSRERLITSWEKAMNESEFKNIIDMFISHSVSKEPSLHAHRAMQKLQSIIESALPKTDSREIMVQLFGQAVVVPIATN